MTILTSMCFRGCICKQLSNKCLITSVAHDCSLPKLVLPLGEPKPISERDSLGSKGITVRTSNKLTITARVQIYFDLSSPPNK